MSAGNDETTETLTVTRLSERTQSRTLRPYARLARRLTRAHVMLGERPRFAQLGHSALGAICRALASELGCEVTARARLLESAVTPARGVSSWAAFLLLDLSVPGGTGLVELAPPALLAVLERFAGIHDAQPAPLQRLTRLESALLSYLGLAALAGVRTQEELHRQLGPRLAGATLEREAALAHLDGSQGHLAVELELSIGTLLLPARLLLPTLGMQRCLRELAPEPAGEPAPEVLAACLLATCRIGRSPLSAGARDSLCEGDVICFEGVRRQGDQLVGAGSVTAPGFSLEGHFSAAGFSESPAPRAVPSQEVAMPIMKERSAGKASLPVEVEIELTRLLLPVSELAALRPGGVLPLRISASEPVVLRIGERAVASAELVDIEGEVGARILALLP